MDTPPCYSTSAHKVLQDAWKTDCDAVQQQKMMASYNCHAVVTRVTAQLLPQCSLWTLLVTPA